MQTALQKILQQLATARDEGEIRQSIMEEMGAYFSATRWGLCFLDQLPVVDEHTPRLIRQALSLDHNPVLRYLMQRHAAIHEEMILPSRVWQTLCPRSDHGHVMLGPIVSSGQLLGGVAFTRHRDQPAFDDEDLVDVSTLCLHLSTRLTELRAKPTAVALKSDRLTARETQIAELVALGLTNREIGQDLWITENSVKQALKRMFRKLAVSSRAEMVAQLARQPETAPQGSTAA